MNWEFVELSPGNWGFINPKGQYSKAAFASVDDIRACISVVETSVDFIQKLKAAQRLGLVA